MKKKICKEAGCNELIDNGSYCIKHIKEKPAPFSNAVRYNEELYNTSRWRELRRELLKENPYCHYCWSTHKLQVHHLKPPLGNEELFFEESNLRVVCEKCHKLLTLCEIQERKHNT